MKRVIFLLMPILVLGISSMATTYYVCATNGNDAHSGTTWQRSFIAIQ